MAPLMSEHRCETNKTFFRLFGLNKNPQQGVPLDAPQVPVMGEGGGDDGKQVCTYIVHLITILPS